MKILAIETSCDETAVAILDAQSTGTSSSNNSAAQFTVLSHAIISQIDVHQEYGGVFPAMAKREHAKNLVPLLGSALEEAEMLKEDLQTSPDALSEDLKTELSRMLEREPDLAEAFLSFITETERPEIDAIAVTYGPGLAPALWVGVNFAQALSLAWNIPLVPINHMEGHFLVGLAEPVSDASEIAFEIAFEAAFEQPTQQMFEIKTLEAPILGLLISGGHTQLMLMEQWLSYRLLGETRDDAVGEAFDKVARMMGLQYPGGPEISKLASRAREDVSNALEKSYTLPRPMLDSGNYDFSFSGIKTAVLYLLRDMQKKDPDQERVLDTLEKEALAREFEDAVTEVLLAKTARALEETQAQTLVVGGGVSANAHIQQEFSKMIAEKFPYVELCFPPEGYTGDNAVMIGIAGFYRAERNEFIEAGSLVADGNLSLDKKAAV